MERRSISCSNTGPERRPRRRDGRWSNPALPHRRNLDVWFVCRSPDDKGRTVAEALARGVRIGAHPGYPDRASFGRNAMDLPLEEIRALGLYQLGALDGFVRARGGRLSHVKAHGALYT